MTLFLTSKDTSRFVKTLIYNKIVITLIQFPPLWLELEEVHQDSEETVDDNKIKLRPRDQLYPGFLQFPSIFATFMKRATVKQIEREGII